MIDIRKLTMAPPAWMVRESRDLDKREREMIRRDARRTKQAWQSAAIRPASHYTGEKRL